MAARGAGSKGSPIIISDDEGEASVNQQLPQEPYSAPLDARQIIHTTMGEHSEAPKSMKMMLNMGYTPGLGLGRDLDGFPPGPVEPVPLVLKRKRDEGGVGCDRYSGSPARVIVERLEGAFLRPESKKARKRRRRLERETLGRQQSWEHHTALHRSAVEMPQPPNFESKPRIWPNQPNSGSVSAWHSWPGVGAAFNPHQYSRVSDTIGRFHRPPPNDAASLFSLSLPNSTFDNANNSMGPAMSLPLLDPVFPVQASNIEPNVGGILPARPPFSHGPLGPHSLDCPLLPMSQPGPSRPPIAQAPSKLTPAASGPSGVKKVLPVGMKPQSLDSTHGLFHRTTSTSAQAHRRRPHIPDPSRTLVIEQLPKSKRNREFVWNWCKDVCGTAPVHLELDANRKALVEFENAEMARALFSSPRFQGDPGRAAIRVWWYRLEGPEPAAGDGEIEEGEIEEDASNKWQRLTKKDKKAQKKKKKEQIKQNRNVISDGQARSRLNGGFTSNNDSRSSIDPSPLHPFEPAKHPSIHLTNNYEPPTPSFTGDCSPTVWAAEPKSHSQDYPVCSSVNAMAVLHDDRASIASSRHGSPLVVSSIPTKETDVDSSSKNMEVDSPVRFQLLNEYWGSNHPQTDTSASRTATLPKSVQGVTAPNTPVPPPAQPVPVSRSNIPSSFLLNSAVHGTTPVSSVECTPMSSSDIPSELRATKDPPKGPSHAKRSLQARQKELEERIARSKLLSQASNGSGVNGISLDSTPAGARSDTVTPIMSALPTEGTEPGKVTEEGHLRQLVLESKRNKILSTLPNTQPSTEPPSALPHSADTTPNISPISDVTLLVYSGTPDSPVPPVVSGSHNSTAAHNALEDLAVSFITEAIQTTKPLPLKPSPAMMKLELAAKQRWLEQQIAESKLLMVKLNLAQTKQEKDAILRVMRERSRLTESEMKPSAGFTGTVNHHLDHSVSQVTDIPSGVRWPETTEDAGIFIVSDDEEEV